MEIRYRDRKLQARVENEVLAVRAWGTDVARVLTRRLALLEALEQWDDIRQFAAARAHPLHGARNGQWSLYLVGRWRLIVEPERSILYVLEVSNHYGD